MSHRAKLLNLVEMMSIRKPTQCSRITLEPGICKGIPAFYFVSLSFLNQSFSSLLKPPD